MSTLSLPNLSPAELADAANANLVTHASWVQARTTGMRVFAEDDLVLVDCGLPCDTFNLLCRAAGREECLRFGELPAARVWQRVDLAPTAGCAGEWLPHRHPPVRRR